MSLGLNFFSSSTCPCESSDEGVKASLHEMAVARQDFSDPVAAHRGHRHAIYLVIAFAGALFVQSQFFQERMARLRVNRHALIARILRTA